MHRLLRRTSLAAVLTVAAAQISLAQARTDVIRGNVKTDSGRVVAGADIYVTMAPDRISFHANSDSSGAYTVVVPNATGDYLVHISAIGRLAVRKRVTRVGAESTFVVDAILRPSVAQMAAVRVQASKQRPSRAADTPTSGGSADRVVDGVVGAIAPSDVGDVNAAAMTVPGALQAAGGFSVLGLPSSQNAVTVGGLAFPGADLPRDARTTTRFATSTYDPSRGWFSGASANVDLITGSLFSSARGHLSADAPALPSGLPSGSSSRLSNLQASYGADGPFTYQDRDFYNYSVQLSRQSTDLRSLVNAPASLFDAIGLSTDSVARVLRALDALHVPLRGAGARVTETGSFMLHVDHAPVDLKTYTPAKTTFGVTAYGKAVRTSALSTAPTSTPGYGGEGSSEVASLQAFYSRFLTPDYLNETRSSLSVTRSRIQPYVEGPSGHLLLGTETTADGVGSLLDLDFGGNGGLASNNRSWTWELQNETRFYASSRASHRVKVAMDSRIDGYDRTGSAGPTGSFTYASLADLEANRPSAFTRVIGNDDASGAEWNGYLAVGDFWRATPSLQLMYGARVEANRFLSTARRSADIEGAFGARTDFAPNTIAISPRLGFTWYFRPPTLSMHTTSIGTFNVGPSAYLRGGIGEFRNFTPANLLSPAIASNAPGSRAIRLTCLGSATPLADWGLSGANPSACAPGSQASFADTAHDVRFVDGSYRTPHSWRANLAYGSTVGGLTYAIEGIYSLNLDQPDFRDLNLRRVSSFKTSDEGREVFAPTSAIVASTGAVSPSATRVDDRFGAVVAASSSARSVSKQATLTVTPALPDNWFFSGSYTLGSIRSRESGFTGSTFNDPAGAAWGRGDLDVRHHFIASLGYMLGGFAISGQGHATSGMPFTPIVGSDVNGDGYANDRAFVFMPGGTSDSKLASDLAALTGADRTARHCLLSARGRAAAQNECQGPWSFSLNAQASLSTAGLRAHRVSSINLSLANPLAGLDAVLHGTPGLRGWGSINRPDPILYRVRGFDASNQRYQYEVNPAFARTSTTRMSSLNPFRLTLDVSFNLGRPLGEQQMDQWLKPGRDGNAGTKLTAADLKKRYERNVPDPYALVVNEADSLLLSRDQVERLKALRAEYRPKIDSVIARLSEHMASLGDKYNATEALRYQETTLDQAWEITRQAVRRDFPLVLSPIQLTLLPGWAWTIYRAESPLIGMRSFSFGPL
jgi:hypothetical protein